MPYARTSLRAEHRALRERMRALGMSHRQIAVEFARCFSLRPRAAWRHAHGWSLKEAAERINAYAAHNGLSPDGNTVAMTGAHLCEYESWPGYRPEPAGRRPTPYLLSLLAVVYGATVHDLLDVADYEHLPAADRLILDKTTHTAHSRLAAPSAALVGGAQPSAGAAPARNGRASQLSLTAARDAPAAGTAVPVNVPPPLAPLAALAAALLAVPRVTDRAQPRRLSDQATQLWRLRQQARYRKIADHLPRALACARGLEAEQGPGRQLAAQATLAHLYNAASSVAKSLGSFELAGIAADRAVKVADATGDPLLGGAAAYRLANVLLSARQFAPARAVAVGAADRLRPVMTASRSHTAMWGALLATAALAAARAHAAAEAWELLGASRVAGDLLGTEHADLFSIFGPANWLIHAVNVAADLGDAGEAIRRAGQVQPRSLPPFLAERRTFLLLGRARGHCLRGDAASAAAALLDAEQAAPEEVRTNPDACALVAGLLAGSPVRNEPLRGLAARMRGPGQPARTSP